MRQCLEDRGFAEPHLHLKAALDFPSLWISLQRAIAATGAKRNMFASPGAELGEGYGLGELLIRCSLARLVLAGYLNSPYPRSDKFGVYLRRDVVPRMQSVQGPVAAALFHRALRDLACGEFSPELPSFEFLRVLYASLIAPTSTITAGKSPGNLAKLDPLARWYPGGRQGNPEAGFQQAAFEYLEGTGREDSVFAHLFWQSVRARTVFYRHVIQRPMTPGLQWFTRTYARLSARASPCGWRRS